MQARPIKMKGDRDMIDNRIKRTRLADRFLSLILITLLLLAVGVGESAFAEEPPEETPLEAAPEEVYTETPHEHVPGEAVTENAIDAGCGWDGSHDEAVYCADCGEELSRATVTDPATGAHQWDQGVVTLQPTVCEEGVITYTCQVCGATESQQIEKLHAARIVFETEDGAGLTEGIRLWLALTEEEEEAGKEPEPVQPEEDGSWLLLHGMYVYTVETAGFVHVERAPLIVEVSTAENEETITITLVPEPTAEPEPAVEQGASGLPDAGAPEQIIPEEETVEKETVEGENPNEETPNQETAEAEPANGEPAEEAETTAAPVLALELTYNGEPQRLLTSLSPGTWIRIEAPENEGEWILIDDPQDPEETAFSRMNAGAYQVYWYYGEEAPTLTEDGQYAGEVEIAKADPVILVAPA